MNFFTNFIATLIAIATFFTSGGITQLVNKGDISGFADTVMEYKIAPDFTADENGDFTVLQFSDTHFTTGISYTDISLLNKMEELTKKYTPDLVVVSGDMINDGDFGAFNKQFVLDKVASLFESLEQYWAFIPGNNDGLNYGSSADITAYLSQYEHSLASDLKEISGGAQYSIDITENGKLIHSLLFLDTMDYDSEDPNHTYGYVHADQVNWCKDEIEKKQSENSDVKFSVFLHENTPNFRKAGISGEKYKDGYKPLKDMAEKYDIPKNEPLDKVFENSKAVGLLSMGHSHPKKNECSFYNGTYYHVTAQTAKMSTLITIHTKADDIKSMYDFEMVK